jgi:glycosyltransferase involved in cell wall biosynthesis
MNDFVSIIIPCYNGEEFLDQTLASILWQTHQSWECVLIDDGSTDKSAEIFHRYVLKDSRFRYHYQKNRGAAAARNVGISLARGTYIQFLDDDDLLLPERLAVCLSAFHERQDSGVVYSDYVCFSPGNGFSRTLPGKIPYEDATRAFLFELNVTFVTLIHAFLFRREIVAANIFDDTFHSYAEDVECWVRIASSGARFVYVNQPSLISAKIRILEEYANRPIRQKYHGEYERALLYWKQRLVMGFFMEKKFHEGRVLVAKLWRVSALHSRIKMIGWWILMIFFSKDFITRLRGWIVRCTPFRWGGWRQFRSWDAPGPVRRLLGISG